MSGLGADPYGKAFGRALEIRKTVTLSCGHTIKLRFMPNKNMKFPCSAQQNCGYQLRWIEAKDDFFPEITYNNERTDNRGDKPAHS